MQNQTSVITDDTHVYFGNFWVTPDYYINSQFVNLPKIVVGNLQIQFIGFKDETRDKPEYQSLDIKEGWPEVHGPIEFPYEFYRENLILRDSAWGVSFGSFLPFG